jgi:hypothetical protein
VSELNADFRKQQILASQDAEEEEKSSHTSDEDHEDPDVPDEHRELFCGLGETIDLEEHGCVSSASIAQP